MRQNSKQDAKKQFLKVKNSLLELQKYFIKLTDRKLRDRKVEVKGEIEELLFRLIINDMDKFEQKTMKEIKTLGMIG